MPKIIVVFCVGGCLTSSPDFLCIEKEEDLLRKNLPLYIFYIFYIYSFIFIT